MALLDAMSEESLPQEEQEARELFHARLDELQRELLFDRTDASYPAILPRGVSLIHTMTQSLPAEDDELKFRRVLAESSALVNASRPVHQLPPDVLSDIFMRYRNSQKADELADEPLDWIRVTHVCRYWRWVALECTALWTNLSFSNPELAQAMLQRSKDSPLVVEHTCKPRDETLGEALLQALAQTHRLRVIKLASYGGCACKENTLALLKTSLQSAPVLEELFLEYGGANTPMFPSEIFSAGAPALRRLGLTGYSFSNWRTFPSGATLTDLHLAHHHDIHGRPSAEDFLRCLTKLTVLTRLSLAFYIPRSFGGPTSVRTPVVLPALQHLHISDSIQVANAFFNAVQLPMAKTLELEFPNLFSTLATYSVHQLLSSLKSSWKTIATGHVTDFRISQNEVFFFSFAMNSTFSMSFQNSALSGGKLGQLAAIFKMEMQLAPSLQTLVIEKTNSLDKASWCQLFGTMPNLSSIALCGSEPLDFVAALGSDSQVALTSDFDGERGTVGHSRKGVLPFPALTEISFSFVDFDPCMSPKGKTLKDLTRALTRRHRVQPIQTLGIYECSSFFKDHYERIRKALPGTDVKWRECSTAMGKGGLVLFAHLFH